MKAFANNRINLFQKHKFLLGWVESIAGKGENAGYQHFLLFPQCFQKPSVSGSLKLGLCGKEINDISMAKKLVEKGENEGHL